MLSVSHRIVNTWAMRFKFTKNNSVIWFDLFKAFSFDLFLIKDSHKVPIEYSSIFPGSLYSNFYTFRTRFLRGQPFLASASNLALPSLYMHFKHHHLPILVGSFRGTNRSTESPQLSHILPSWLIIKSTMWYVNI
jgi:hypothetical protein